MALDFNQIPLVHQPRFVIVWKWNLLYPQNYSIPLCCRACGLNPPKSTPMYCPEEGQLWRCEGFKAHYQSFGFEWSCDWPWTISLLIQYRFVPRRQTDHFCSRRRSHHFHSHGEHGLCRGCWRLHDPPICAGNHGYTHLPAFIVFQAHCRSCRCRTEGIFPMKLLLVCSNSG